MKKTLMMGLLGVLLGAGAAVATVTTGAEEAAAAPCCSSCPSLQECIAECGGNTTCESFCRTCVRICSPSC